MRVEVYWNFHKKVYSVRALDGHMKGRVIAHAGRVLLRDVSLAVQAAGRDRVRLEGRKNLHAFMRGTLEAMQGDPTHAFKSAAPWTANMVCGTWTKEDRQYARAAHAFNRPIFYNPYSCETFEVCVKREGAIMEWAPIREAPMVLMSATKGRSTALYLDPCRMPETA